MNAAESDRFTVEGDTQTIFEMAETFGWTITHPRWWQRTYAIPRWIVWLVIAQAIVALPHSIEVAVGWFS